MAESNPNNAANLEDDASVKEPQEKAKSPPLLKETDDEAKVSEENVSDKHSPEVADNCKEVLNTPEPPVSSDKPMESTATEEAKEDKDTPVSDAENLPVRDEKDEATRKISGGKDADVSEKEEILKQENKLSDDTQEKSVDKIISEEEEKLNEILKIVNDNLNASDLEPADRTEGTKDEDDQTKDDKTQNVEKKDEKDSKNEDNVKVEDDESVSETIRLKKDVDTATETSKEIEKPSEVGIVGPPTAVSELINEEELRAETTLSTEQKLQEHVAEWVQNSVKVEALSTAEVEEEENDVQNDSRQRRKNLREKRARKRKSNEIPVVASTRKSQRLVVSNIIKKSIKCLNKMHAMESAGGNGKKVDAAEKARDDDSSRASPKVPQSQQNGAALPEETAAATTAADRLRSTPIKKELLCDQGADMVTKNHHSSVDMSQQKNAAPRCLKADAETGRKRKSTDGQLSSNGTFGPKKFCLEQREQYITSLIGCEKVTAEELAARADQLRAEVQALDELARAKEMEWNEILSMRKLKEEAYLRVERRRQVMGFMEGNGQLNDQLPPASLALGPEWESSGNTTPVSKEKCSFESKEDLPEENSQDSPPLKKDKNAKSTAQRQSTPPKQGGENGRKQAEALSPDNRQIGEGRQGTIVDVRSIIADYRLRHPETVPRRGRRMRNSVNVGLGAGGAMVETGHSVDSRPSSTDSCKSNSNAVDPNNSMSFKDVLVQFAKLSQQQGEPVKTPQNYPDVTLHPVAPSPAAQQNTPPQQTGSLLHGILTKSQSPRPTTFSPTLARLLTAPERERNAPTATSIPQQSAATQHLLQAYQGSNPVSISDLLSSSKARTEITITPVVNTPVQSHSNNLIHVEDVEEETAGMDDRETRISSGGRDTREDRDSPPRCQGCHERAAQFVCAGCGNQWYCSRECQVAAWDEHSEVCSG